MEFVYTGIDKSAVRKSGKLDAGNEREVLEYLRGSGLTPISIKKINKSSGFLMFKKVKSSEIILFTRQLASMTMTGLTLIESLKILKEQKLKPGMQELVNDLIVQVSEGNSFSKALSAHREYFSEVYISLIKAAEKGGLMDKILARLADNLERSDELRKRVKSALFYPSIVITGVIVVILVMNVFVIPQLGMLYTSLNLELPLTTRIVLGFSDIVKNFWVILIFAGVGLFLLYRRYKKTEVGMKVIDKIKMRLPIVGPIIVMSSLDEITRTLSLLISSGTSIIESLEIGANVAGNYWFKYGIIQSKTLVEKGVAFSDAMASTKVFPPIMIQMAKVGESTGKIDESLLKVSDYFERDLDIRIRTLTTAIEPIMIIILGVSVGFLILSIITPIYGLISQFQ